MKTRLLLKIEGRVQGVFFRQSTREMAHRLGLTGWVRNCPDGSVEALFEGEQSIVLEALEWCRQGPPASKVINLEPHWQDYQGEFTDFRIRY